MTGPSTRLKDVAEATGFSVNTVSLALRDSPRIPAATRSLIREVADQLNYLPNHVAKSLVSRETKSIGLILTDLKNPVLTSVAQCVERKLAASGYTTLFATSNNTLEEEIRMIETFRSRRADGMLIFPFSHRKLDHIRRLRDRNYPVVMLVGEQDAGIDAVSMDERSGAHKAVRHLIETGHRRIALVDGATTLGNDEKYDGYCQAHADAGIAIVPRLLVDPKGHSVEAGYRAMADLVAAGGEPTAVFASNDSLALGILRYCAEHGLDVPQDVSIIGVDNIEFAEFAVTPISTVSYDVERISQLAVSRVLDLIQHGGDLPEPRIVQVEPDLLIRRSSDKRIPAVSWRSDHFSRTPIGR